MKEDRTTATTVIAYAGEPGAFAEDAVLAAFGRRRAASPSASFRAVFEAVAGGDAAAGVVPIENVIHGTVRENYDLLLEHDLAIVGEVVVPVRLCLAALPGQRLDDIERVYSHIQALGQAEAFLRARPWQLLTTYNTAGAGKAIADRGERGAAAVALAAGRRPVRPGGPGRRDRRPARTTGRASLVLARPGDGRPAAARSAGRSAGRPSSSRSATSRARCSPSCASSPRTA